MKNITKKLKAISRRLKLDSHHGIERFGVFIGALTVIGTLVLGSSFASAMSNNKAVLSEISLYTPTFTSSKTALAGGVDGIYVSSDRTKALVMMHFEEGSNISYKASDYQAFLLGSSPDLKTESLATAGITGEVHVFGSTGYLGVLLQAQEPFAEQVLNLTMRSNAELSVASEEATGDTIGSDNSFLRHDQWRIFFNPAGSSAPALPALDEVGFSPAKAFYDVVLEEQEADVRKRLDAKLVAMRTDLTQIESYTADLQTTKVDGLFLRAPKVPESIAGDKVVGQTSGELMSDVDPEQQGEGTSSTQTPEAESEAPEATLELQTDHVVPGGVDLDWREGNVYDGYLRDLVPDGESITSFLAGKREEVGAADQESVSGMRWILSDGSDLVRDYQTTDGVVRPLVNVMNNLSRAYSSYEKNKSEYQSALVFELLGLDIDLRDVEGNSSVNNSDKALQTFY